MSSKESMSFQEEISILKYNPNPNPDSMKWTSNLEIHKFNNNESLKSGVPDEITKVKGNTALLSGINTLWKLINGQTTNVYPLNEENAYIGIGDSSAVASANQTSLLGANIAYSGMDNGIDIYPSIANNIMTLRAKFGPSEANFTWNEWGVLNGDPSNPGGRDPQTIFQFNRKVEPMGVKAEGSTWVVIATLSINP